MIFDFSNLKSYNFLVILKLLPKPSKGIKINLIDDTKTRDWFIKGLALGGGRNWLEVSMIKYN